MDLSLSTDDQDRVIYLCILDTAFLGQIMRKKIQSAHFASEVRQKVFKTISEFYVDYKKAPGADIIAEIESKIRRKRIKAEDKEMYEEYLLNVMSIPPFPHDLVTDRLDFFVKTRIVSNLSNSLLKLQDFFDINPDKALMMIRDAIVEADSSIGRKGVESILNDPIDNLQPSDFMTKFGIDPIDRQLGGGLKRGNYVVIQGYLGMGKSWCINHLAKMAVRFGHSPLVIPTEMSNRTARLRFRQSFTGLTGAEIFDQPEKVRQQTASSMNKGADIYLLSEEEKSMSVDELPAVIEDTESKTGKTIDLLLIDSADDFQPPHGRYANKLDANTAIHTFLKNFAKNEDKCVVTTAQVQRIGETKFWLGASNVGDNINKFRKATVGLSLNGIEMEKKRGYYRMWLFKNTDGSEGAKVWAKRDFRRGQFITRYSRFVNKKLYTEMVEIEPIIDKIDEEE